MGKYYRERPRDARVCVRLAFYLLSRSGQRRFALLWKIRRLRWPPRRRRRFFGQSRTPASSCARPSIHPSIGHTKADLGVVSARDDAHPQTGKGKRSEKGAKNRFCESPLINQIIDVCAPNHIDVCGDDMSLLFGISCCNHAIAEQLFPTIAYMDNQ